MFFARHMSVQKTDCRLFRRLRPAEVCDAALPGEGRWTEALGRALWGVTLMGYSGGRGAAGRLRRVPSRASPLDGAFREPYGG